MNITKIALKIVIFLLSIGILHVQALTPNDIANPVFFLDAQNLDGDNNSGNEPANNSKVSLIVDTFNSYSGAQDSVSKQPSYTLNSINTFPSLQFDGISHYMNITDNQTINTAPSYTQKSYAMIIKTGADINTFQTIYEEGGKEKGYAFQLDGGHIYAGTYNTVDWSTPNKYKVVDLGAVAANTVYTLILIYDSDNNFVNGYLDGALITTLVTILEQKTHGACIFDAGIGCSLYSTGSTSIGIGAAKNDVLRLSNTSSVEILEGHYFKGNIGEISSWNHALTLVEKNGIQDYLMDKWFPDSIPPVITSTKPGTDSLLPGGNHDIEFNYNDTHTGSLGINTSSTSFVLEKWNGTSWINNTNFSHSSTTVTQSIYATSNLNYGKYKATFTIEDNAGNISSDAVIIFYIDTPSMVISSDTFDLGTLSSLTNQYSQVVTVTVKTVGAPFKLNIKNETDLTHSTNTITPYNGTVGYGKKDSTNIIAMVTPEVIANQPGQIDNNGNLQTYTFNVQLGSIINELQAAGNYDGTVAIDISYDYYDTNDDTTGLGLASASSTLASNSPSDGFDNNITTSGWGNNNVLPAWLQYDLGSGNAKVISTYSLLRSASQIGGWVSNTYSEVDWTFQGSHNATTWITLDNRIGELVNMNLPKKSYSCSNSTAYRYYRIYITQNNGGSNWVNITEMEMFE